MPVPPPNGVEHIYIWIPVKLCKDGFIQVLKSPLRIGEATLDAVLDPIPFLLKPGGLWVGPKSSPGVHTLHADFRKAYQGQIVRYGQLQEINFVRARLGHDVIHPVLFRAEGAHQSIPLRAIEKPCGQNDLRVGEIVPC